MEKFKEILNKIGKGLLWFLKSYIWITPLCIAVDQTSKLLLEKMLLAQPGLRYDDWFLKGFMSLQLSYNKGAAWSLLNEHPAILAVLSVVASIGIIAYIAWKYKKLNLTYRICGFLILGGCMGNMIDRIFYPKGVIDFLQFDFIDFPIFNGADSMLVIGIIIILIRMIYDDIKAGKNKKKNDTQPESK